MKSSDNNNIVKNDAVKGDNVNGLFFVIESQKNLIEQQSDTIRRHEHTIAILQKALFGPRSERIVDPDENQGVFESILNEVDKLNGENETVPETSGQENQSFLPRRRKKRSSLQDLVPDNLPKEEVVIDIPESEKTAPDGTTLKKIGEERVEKLAYRPGSWYLKVFIYPKYAHPNDALAGIKKAPAPDFAIPGGIFDESFLAWIAYDKCSMHLPLYRQEEAMRCAGINISRQTLSHLYLKSAGLLKPLYELMIRKILSRDIIFTDDTPVRMLAPGTGKTRKTYMWVYVGGGCGPPYRVFEFTLKRNGKCPKKFLKDFKGYVHADAFNGFDQVFACEDITECSCWMHVRRKYIDSLDAPVELRKQVLRLIRNLYRYERAIKNRDREKERDFILKIRKEKIGPLIDKVFNLTAEALKTGQVLPESNFAGAISYMHNLGDTLKTFLENPYLSPDNGESERALRPLTVGRKNWLFAGSENGGEATAILLSLIQTCRVMNINPSVYLEDVLRRINSHPYNRLEELLPGNWEPLKSYYQ